MRLSDLWHALAGLFVPVVLVTTALGLGALLTVRLTKHTFIPGQRAFIVAFGFLGSITGIIAGVSQQSIVSALLTGLLGVISSLLAYLLGKESLVEWRPVIPVALILLLLSTLAGLTMGSIYKKDRTEYERAYARRIMLYEKVDLEICKEELLRKLRGETFPPGYVMASCAL
ncbi:hypothetical protein [Pseudomonas sp.]|uniref:hypothetical protein n=1 Tax=Pseudomonas sp. TaxID=306 RepID=UPI003F40B8A7